LSDVDGAAGQGINPGFSNQRDQDALKIVVRVTCGGRDRDGVCTRARTVRQQ
jgi:hypothetical protein